MAIPTAPAQPFVLSKYAGHQRVKCASSSALAPDYPAPTDVRAGVHYANLSYLGNMTEPAPADVRSGKQYGANGTEFTGTMSGSGGGGGTWGWVS